MTRRWRPSLSLVLGGALAGTLALSLLGMVALRYLGPEIGFRRAAMMLALAIAAATAVLGWLLVRLLLRPIRALERFATEQESGTPPRPPDRFGTRELHATGRRVIAMAAALRNREASIRAYTDHVTHELKTPVAAIRAGVELLEDSPSLTPNDRGLLAQIDSARMQLEAQLAALREAARAREARHLGTSTLAEVLPALAEDWPQVSLVSEGAEIPVPIAAPGLHIILSHLVRNASEHGADQVTLKAAVAEGACRIIVSDNGTGISPGNAARVFDPFFTTRREDGGTGMGLVVVRNALRAHGGEITLAEAGNATCFLLSFWPTHI